MESAWQDLAGSPVVVVGAGIMGVGTAQVAAQGGHSVMLYDSRPGAAAEAKNRLRAGLTSSSRKAS